MTAWYLTPTSIGYLAQFILALTIAIYLLHLTMTLWRRKTETLPTALLSGFFVSLAVFIFLSFLDVSLHPDLRLYALYWITSAIALSLVFLLQFAYRFPSLSPRQVWEARVVLGLSLSYVLWEVGFAVYRLGLLAEQDVRYRPELADFPLAIGALWLLVVFLRQTVRASNDKSWWRAILRPQGQPARAARGFALIFASFLGLSALELARTYRLVPGEMRQIGFSLVILLALFAFALFYLNAVPETTTFMTKLVGIALVTILAIEGIIGWLIFPFYLDTCSVDELFQQKQTLRFAPNSRGGYDIRAAPFSFETDLGTRLDIVDEAQQVDKAQQEVQLTFPFPFYGQNWDTVYVLDDGTVSLGRPLDWKDVLYHYGPSPAILALFVDLDPQTPTGGVYARNESDRLTLTWYRVPDANHQNTYTFQLVLHPDGVFDLTFYNVAIHASDIYDSANMSGLIGAVPGGEKAGVQHINLATDLPYASAGNEGIVDNLYLRLRQHVHQPLRSLAYLIVISSLVVVVGFPQFFRLNLVKPLNTLLDGVRQVNAGDLSVAVPIQSEDEIGFLVHSFNEMVRSLRTLNADLRSEIAERRRAEEELRQHRDHLEDLVGERTADLMTAVERLEQEITERRRAEGQLQRYAAELEQANEEVRRFAYVVSHDLRAPLTNLKGFAEELHHGLEAVGPVVDAALSHLDEEQQQAVTRAIQEDIPEALGFIDSSVTRMDHFISALLELSRLGRRELYLEPIDMNAVVQATLRTLAHQIEERQVKVSVGPLPEVVADRTAMEQIVGNILDNAVKYLDPGRPGEIEITGKRGEAETTLCIHDNGRGIAEEDMDKVFAPFRRAGKQDVPGEGMGLAYVQALVRRHGGRIWCESQLGMGTTFTLTLSNQLVEGLD